MDLEVASQKFQLPLKALMLLRKKGLISSPLLPAQVRNLSFLSYVWGDTDLLRIQMTKFDRKRRLNIITSPDLTKIERYILNRYLNAKRGTKIPVQLVCKELQKFYQIKGFNTLKRKIYKIRQKAYNMKRKKASTYSQKKENQTND